MISFSFVIPEVCEIIKVIIYRAIFKKKFGFKVLSTAFTNDGEN